MTEIIIVALIVGFAGAYLVFTVRRGLKGKPVCECEGNEQCPLAEENVKAPECPGKTGARG